VNVIFPKTDMFLDQHSNQIGLRDKFTVYVKFRLTARVRCFYISVILLSLPLDFKDMLWIGLDIRVGIGFGETFF